MACNSMCKTTWAAWCAPWALGRKPPVTHVMVYLGRAPDGDLLMAGAQNSRGVDIYKFQPRVPYGGHGGFLGLFKKQGRVVAFGRLR